MFYNETMSTIELGSRTRLETESDFLEIKGIEPGPWQIYRDASDSTHAWMWLKSRNEESVGQWRLHGHIGVDSGAVRVHSEPPATLDLAGGDGVYVVYVKDASQKIVEIMIEPGEASHVAD